MNSESPKIVALSGGVGGAKLLLGLSHELAAGELSVIANTGDDFDHLGFRICPDVDTLLYTLSGLANPEQGWGVRDETWQFMDALEQLGGETWFRLGDRDLATHVTRRELISQGKTLSEVCAQLRDALGISTPVWPMSDDTVATQIHSNKATLDFQDYFVRQQAKPVATGISYSGAVQAEISPAALSALRSPRLEAIVVTPSNPWLSIGPILSVPGIEATLKDCKVPVVGISPIVAGQALKGPTAKIMQELGYEQSVLGVASYYKQIIADGLLTGLVIDERDAVHQPELEQTGIKVGITNTVMKSLEDKRALATYVLSFAKSLSGAA